MIDRRGNRGRQGGRDRWEGKEKAGRRARTVTGWLYAGFFGYRVETCHLPFCHLFMPFCVLVLLLGMVSFSLSYP